MSPRSPARMRRTRTWERLLSGFSVVLVALIVVMMSGPSSRAQGEAGSPSPGSPARPAGGRGAVEDRSRILGQGACTNCHEDQFRWWRHDAHLRTIDRFLKPATSVECERIARLYGLGSEEMLRGDRICMKCHGTVPEGRTSVSAPEGVSCESCHGGARDWLEPHKKGNKPEGDLRAGYREALTLGMRKLRDLDVLAAVCTDCHLITDQRLLRAGHPAGIGKAYVDSVATIKHWDRPLPPRAPLDAAFRRAQGARGPVLIAPALPTYYAPPPESAIEGEGGTGAFRRRRVRPAELRPVARAAPSAYKATLPKFPVIDASVPIEKSLLILRDRLEMLSRTPRS